LLTVGPIVKVIGISTATPVAGPSPGSMPTIVPRIPPNATKNR